jgi:hypothetical protein
MLKICYLTKVTLSLKNLSTKRVWISSMHKKMELQILLDFIWYLHIFIEYTQLKLFPWISCFTSLISLFLAVCDLFSMSWNCCLYTKLCVEMEDLTTRLCWELVKKEGYIAMWRKPLNNSCYMNRDPAVKPPLCDTDDNPDDVWYV